jgi:hypothetical protein
MLGPILGDFKKLEMHFQFYGPKYYGKGSRAIEIGRMYFLRWRPRGMVW